jgi:hypothetical protein
MPKGEHHSLKTHCPKGHPYDEENTYLKPRKGGAVNRICKECNRIRNRKYGPRRSEVDRFWSKVVKGESCWSWSGFHNRGRGIFWPVGSKKTGVLAYRYSFSLVMGDIDSSVHLHHSCLNPGCVNPDHLEPMSAKRHAFLHSPQGSLRS